MITHLIAQLNSTGQDIQLPMERLVVKFQAISTEAMFGVLEVELSSPAPEGLELPGSISLCCVLHRQNDGYALCTSCFDKICQS